VNITPRLSMLLLATLLTNPAYAGTADPERIASHIQTLASDGFAGRRPASEGEEKTVQYLVNQFREMGLQPGGELLETGERSWTQPVPLIKANIEGQLEVSINAAGERRELVRGEDIAVYASRSGRKEVRFTDVPVVFVGFGITAPELGWDDYRDSDVTGKVVLMLGNDPDLEADLNGLFNGSALSYYGTGWHKSEAAARRGAIGIVSIHEDKTAGYAWGTTANTAAGSAFDTVHPDPDKIRPAFTGALPWAVAASFVAKAGLDLAQLKQQAQTPGFKAIELPDLSISAHEQVNTERITTRNVMAVLPGTVRPGETVLVSAHWDHEGVGKANESGDAIYNGAIDNATGVAGMLEIARLMATGPAPERSVVFIGWTAEEPGLLGSKYYAASPVYPLETTAAIINMDAQMPIGPTRDFSSLGLAGNTLEEKLVELGTNQGRSYTLSKFADYGAYFRSDHFPLASKGVPALSFLGGVDAIDGGTKRGTEYMDQYFAHHYHHPSDEYDPSWDLRGMAQDMDLVYQLVRFLAFSDQWPQWNDGSAFKAARDPSAASRTETRP
jgi:Zn-dependent M28 family amino/carboxypeptidase